MKKAKINDQGQITLPVSVRNDLKISVGDEIEFIKTGEGRYEIVVIPRTKKSQAIEDSTTRHLSLAEMRQQEKSSDQEY